MTNYEERGYLDAQLGITSCPVALPENARQWARGHDRAFAEGIAPHPRFGRICRRASPAVEGSLL